MSEERKSIGAGKLTQVPDKILRFALKDNSIKTENIVDGAVTPQKVSSDFVEYVTKDLQDQDIKPLKQKVRKLEKQVNGYSFLYLTESEYKALVNTKKVDPNTIYFVGEDPSDWRFGDSFPVTLSGDGENWKFGNAFPVVFV